MGKQRILTKEQEDQIIYNYTVLHYGQKRSGAFIPVGDSVVKKVLIKHNIPIKSIQETNVNKFWVNHEYFKTPSHDMGYWLGILGSDGCVAGQTNQIYIELQKSDRELLEKLNLSIQNERPVKDYETGRGYENSKLYFYSKDIKSDLAKYKIIPNKTYSEDYGFPDLLPKEYWIDYIRGLFDGDGCIKQSNGNSLCWQVDVGREDIAENIIAFFQEHGIKLGWTICPKQNVDLFRVYAYGKDKGQAIYNLLYSTPSDLFLKRKKEKFETLLNL